MIGFMSPALTLTLTPADWLSTHATLIVAVVGIIVSGLLGPTMAALLARGSALRQFRRDLIRARRDDLRELLDEAARVLGAGATNLRRLKQVEEKIILPDPALEEWAKSIFPLGQRLRLRLPSDHPVVAAYDNVRGHLIEAQTAINQHVPVESALARYEAARAHFLDVGRDALHATIGKGTEL